MGKRGNFRNKMQLAKCNMLAKHIFFEDEVLCHVHVPFYIKVEPDLFNNISSSSIEFRKIKRKKT